MGVGREGALGLLARTAQDALEPEVANLQYPCLGTAPFVSVLVLSRASPPSILCQLRIEEILGSFLVLARPLLFCVLFVSALITAT